jgi:diguanylate cyclase (GGDEF)-like protein
MHLEGEISPLDASFTLHLPIEAGMEATTTVGAAIERDGPARAVVALQCLGLVGAVALIAATAGEYNWSPGMLLVIAGMAVFSDVTAVQVTGKMLLSGSFLGIVLASVLLGGGPAALVGFLTIVIGWLRWREAWHKLVTNIVTFTWFPLVAGLFFRAVTTHVWHVPKTSVAFYLLVFVTFVLALALNFLAIAGYNCHLERASLIQKAREALLPLLSAELFSAVLTMIAVYVAVKLGIRGLALFALVLVIFQRLVGELLRSQRRSKELHLKATVDDLTGLANRESFRSRIEKEVVKCSASGHSFAVIIMDLDRFKEVNDTLGHDFGDRLLKELGPRLAEQVGPAGLVARLGGDEFAIFPGLYTGSVEHLEAFASDLLDRARQPVVIDELSLELDASIGIARFPEDGKDAHTLLRRADLAMYEAKEKQTGWKTYDPELDKHSAQRLSVLSDFRRALLHDEIVLHYQPIVKLSKDDDPGARVVSGAEGLVRWEHPQLGLLPPGYFMPAVEQTGLIGPLTSHVLELAVARCAEWRRSGRAMTVAVNLSVRNLLDRDLPDEVEKLLSRYSLPPKALQLEITESMIMSDPERARATVMRLSDLGVDLSVDDFGTGYSSLANLRQLPIDELKIDRSFVTPMLQDKDDLTIVRSTIHLGHDLGLRIVAEGVEDECTLTSLADLGADLAQGFHLSKPLSPEAFTPWTACAAALKTPAPARNGIAAPAQLNPGRAKSAANAR